MIPIDELLIEYYPKRENKGGQHVGTTTTGIKVTHIPSGIVAIVDLYRSSCRNRTIAIDMITSALTHPLYK